MSVILVHIGCTGPYIKDTRPPAHLTDCIDQYSLFNDDFIYILTDRENIQYLPQRPSILPFAIEDYRSPKITRFEKLYNYGPREFWCVTFTRLMYIENFMREEGLVNLCEFANDVLVYTDLGQFNFAKLYSNLAVTPCGPQHVLDGFMFIPSYEPLARMTQFWIDKLGALGADGITRKYKYDMVNEMTMMHLYSQEVGLDWLPILPYGEHSHNFEYFQSLFDPATWGQFVGGTRTDGPGAKPQNHHIGVELGEHPEYEIEWIYQAESNLLVPFVNLGYAGYAINNLHIHSKNMKPFRSDRE
jgi:hypothetical protein